MISLSLAFISGTGGFGEGKVTFHGYWKIYYHGFKENPTHLKAPAKLPEELESETSLE